MKKNKTILITGSEGFIGSYLKPKLEGAKYLDKKLGHDFDGRVPKSDVIVHLGADPLVSYSLEEPYRSFHTNVNGTMRILEHCRLTGAKIIFASSCQAEANAKNPYALQKYIDELLIKQYADLYGVKYCIFRIFNVFGDGDHGVVGAFLKQKAEGKPLIIKGGGQRRDFIHVEAVTDAIANAVENDLEGTHELGSGRTTSIISVADLISKDRIFEKQPKNEPVHLQAREVTPTMTVQEYLS